MQTSKISLRSFRSQGDQREHSDAADRYLFSSDRIQLRFNRFSLILKSKKTKQNKKTRKETKAVLLFVQISISKLSVNYFKNNTIKRSYLNLNQRHYNGYLRLNKSIHTNIAGKQNVKQEILEQTTQHPQYWKGIRRHQKVLHYDSIDSFLP